MGETVVPGWLTLELTNSPFTLSVHPFYGMALAAVRNERDQQGRRYVMVEHPRGGHLRLPLGWTDRSAPTSPPTVNGQKVRVSLWGLRALAAAVGAIFGLEVSRLARSSADWHRLLELCGLADVGPHRRTGGVHPAGLQRSAAPRAQRHDE
jgi:hypothetical protein